MLSEQGQAGSADVPTDVLAALTAAGQLVPVGPAPTDPAGRVAWWEQHAESDEVAGQALRRLHGWAVDTGQPAAVTAAIGIAISARRLEGERCRREAAHMREAYR